MKTVIAILAMGLAINNSNAHTGKSLVVWYSWGGNTKAVANHIRELTGADTFIIEPVEPYSTDYRTCTEEAKVEINAGQTRAIKGGVDNISEYETVIIGTPNWWSTMAPPVREFITSHDLSGKTVIPFVTHGGGREARCFRDMQEAAAGANFLEGFVVAGNRAKNCKGEVEGWLKRIGVIR